MFYFPLHENLNSKQEQTTDIVLTDKILKMQKRSKTICSDIFVMVVFPSEKGVIFGVLGLSFLFLPQFPVVITFTYRTSNKKTLISIL